MIHESASVTSVLNRILDEIVVGSETSSTTVVRDASGHSNLSEENVITPVVTTKSNEPIRSGSSEEINCRICYDANSRVPIIYPCRCKGTMGAIHLACLERWLEESNRNSCELCGYEFNVERTPRYKALESIVVWLCLNQQQHQMPVRSLRIDILRCVIVTPITIACSYVCIVAADFYSTNKYDNFPPAKWTTYSLLAMLTVLIFSYFLWMYMAIQYHQRVWYYWWQKTSDVRVKLPLTSSANNDEEEPAVRKSQLVSQV